MSKTNENPNVIETGGRKPDCAPVTCSVARPITADELLRINDLAMMVLKSRQNVGKKMLAAAQDVRAITWALCTGQKPPNNRISRSDDGK